MSTKEPTDNAIRVKAFSSDGGGNRRELATAYCSIGSARGSRFLSFAWALPELAEGSVEVTALFERDGKTVDTLVRHIELEDNLERRHSQHGE